jgi:hypothetical protein
MQKFVEGPVQISTKMNNFNKLIAPNAFTAGGSFNTEDIRQMWGNLWSPNPLPNTSGMDDVTYQQSLDLYTKYQNRSLPLHSNFMTAAARNARNDFIITYATPVFQTAEVNFHVTNTEWNQIEYDDLPEGGIANETTFVKWGWTDTSRKKKQELHFSVDLAHDENYGMQTFIENFAQLASTCLLSLYKSTYYSIVHTAYQNKIYDRTNDIPFDISKLFLAEMEAFFAFALDPAVGFNLIREEVRARDGLDLVLLPEGGSRWVKEEGSVQRQLRSRVLNYNTAGERFEAAVDQPGPMTYKSYQLGDNWLDFMETRSFQVNSLDGRLENPLSTKLTLCQFYPPNTDCKPSDDPKSTDPEVLDMWIFYQTKEEGEDRRISFADSLRACGYWDPESGEISQDVQNYIAQLNREGASQHNAPWQFLGQGRNPDLNADIGDYETPSVAALAAIGNCTDYTRMTSVRDKFVGVLYDTVDGQYKQVDYVGSNHLDTLPNEWLVRVVKSLSKKFHEKTGQHMEAGLTALFGLLDRMDRADVTEDWIAGVINANMLATLNGAVNSPNGLPEFRVNAYGGLDLPSSEVATRSGVVYPNGWQSGPGLLTLRDEALKLGSPYGRAAGEATVALEFVEFLIAFIRQYIGDTDVVSPDLAAPWFQFERGLSHNAGTDAEKKRARYAAIAAFIDAIWKRGVPTFLGVPDEALLNDAQNVAQGTGGSRFRAADTTTLIDTLIAGPLTTEIFRSPALAGLRPVINDAVRALCCLSLNVAIDHKEKILAPQNGVAAGMREAMEAYYRFVTTTTNAGRPQVTTKSTARGGPKSDINQRIVNAVTVLFFEKLGDAPTAESVQAAKDVIDKAAEPQSSGGQSLMQDVMKSAMYKQDPQPTLAVALSEYEERVERSGENFAPLVEDGAARRAEASRRTAAADGRPASFFRGNYDSAEPTRYRRSPFISSDKLVEFVRRSGFKWAVPADANTLYTTPDANLARYERQAGAGLVDLGAHQRLSGAFDTLLQASQFSMGAPSGVQQREALQRFAFGAANDEQAQQKLLLHQSYPGPIKARFECYDRLENDLHKIFFLALIQAKNKLDTHLRLREVGAQLINVLLFRPFIEFFACSVIVMKAGEESGAVPISRFDTYISKEDRGYFHIGCSYYSGFIRLNPGNFRMIPYCMPDRFVGGKKCDFMTKSDQWVPHNPLKPSIIALPTPVAERTYASPLHMTNGQCITRPDVDYPSFTGKYSSARFYEARFNSDNVRHVDEQHYERIKYKSVTYASHVAHRGWRAFKDPATGYLKEFEGTGPGCQRAMNIAGAQYVWNGKNALFAKDHATTYTRARAM